jgi:hypothetical protein
MIDGGKDVLGRDTALERIAGNLVRFAEDETALDATTGHHDRVAPRPVIATTPLHRRQLGRTAVLAQPDHQGFVKLSAPIKVNQQAGECQVEALQELVLHPRSARANSSVVVKWQRRARLDGLVFDIVEIAD